MRHPNDSLDINVETAIMQIHSHFSVAKRGEELKDYFEFVEIECKEILRHVTNRSLSLEPTVDRLLHNCSAIKSYFKSLGEDCSRVL